MTRAQQTQVLKRLRELEAALARVDFRLDASFERSAGYVIGQCQAIVDAALDEAGEIPAKWNA